MLYVAKHIYFEMSTFIISKVLTSLIVLKSEHLYQSHSKQYILKELLLSKYIASYGS